MQTLSPPKLTMGGIFGHDRVVDVPAVKFYLVVGCTPITYTFSLVTQLAILFHFISRLTSASQSCRE